MNTSRNTFTVVASTNRGRYALDTPDGQDLTSSQPVSISLGGYWIEGRVEHTGRLYRTDAGSVCGGYFFISTTGTICGLCAGMRIRISTDAPRKGTHNEYEDFH